MHIEDDPNFFIVDIYAVRLLDFYGGIVGMFNTMRCHFLTKKIYVWQVSGSGCAGVHRCRYGIVFIFLIIYDRS